MAGISNCIDGNVTVNHGGYDYWIVKLDGNGNITWQKSLGGNDYDFTYSIQQTADAGYIVAGNSLSINGDVTGNHGNEDSWIVKLDENGNISWQKSLGGSSWEIARAIQQTAEGGYIVGGSSRSNDGDVTGNHGYTDCWIVKLDANGNITWQKSLGGSFDDFGVFIQQTTDGGYIMASDINSISGDITGSHGSNDYWIVKLAGTSAISPNVLWEGLSLYPNPNNGDLLLTGIKEEDYPLGISILDASGRKVYQQNYSSLLDILPLHLQVPSGLYFLTLQNEKGIAYQKFVVLE